MVKVTVTREPAGRNDGGDSGCAGAGAGGSEAAAGRGAAGSGGAVGVASCAIDCAGGAGAGVVGCAGGAGAGGKVADACRAGGAAIAGNAGAVGSGCGGAVARKPRIRSICVEGHAGYAKAGKDIVCAAASATAYTAAGALSELAGLSGAWAERDGYFEISVPASHGVPAGHVGAGQAGSLASSGCAEAALGSPGAAGGQGAGTEAIIDIIMETAYIGYRQIAEAYPRHLELVCR